MTVVKEFPAGSFGYPGLCSADAESSKEFYMALFDWDAEDDKMESGNAFTKFKIDGEDVAGMYEMADDRKDAGIKPHWNSYITVVDVDETAKKAADLGGKVVLGPFDAEGDRMANLEDSTGARFSVWQPVKAATPMREDQPGALCWTELYTTNSDKSAEFYASVFGWRAKPFEGAPVPYTVFETNGDDCPSAGMLQITEEMKGMHPQWVPYFLVPDVDETINDARNLGGEAHGPMDIPTVGRIAIVVDPQGATFAVIKPNPKSE